MRGKSGQEGAESQHHMVGSTKMLANKQYSEEKVEKAPDDTLHACKAGGGRGAHAVKKICVGSSGGGLKRGTEGQINALEPRGTRGISHHQTYNREAKTKMSRMLLGRTRPVRGDRVFETQLRGDGGDRPLGCSSLHYVVTICSQERIMCK